MLESKNYALTLISKDSVWHAIKLHDTPTNKFCKR